MTLGSAECPGPECPAKGTLAGHNRAAHRGDEMPAMLCEKLRSNGPLTEWVEVPESDLREVLADFPVDWQGLQARLTPQGTVLHTPVGRFRIRPLPATRQAERP